MQLIIDQKAIILSVENERLAVQKGETVKHLVPSRLTAIHIMAPCSLTSPVINWAAQYEIPILFYNNRGQVKARIWQPHFGSHAAVRLQQMVFCQSANGANWLKSLLLKKTGSQLYLLQHLPEKLQHKMALERVKALARRLQEESATHLHRVRTIEAGAGRWYWAAVAHALKEHVQIAPRHVRPAKDGFNAMLNYLYGTLYGLVEGAAIASGLDPHISILHRMEYNTPSFVFDLIEPFRHWADEFLIHKILKGEITTAFTEQKGDTVKITPGGKKQLLAQWFLYLEERTPAPKKKIKRKDQVQQLCSSLAAELLKQYKNAQKQKK